MSLEPELQPRPGSLCLRAAVGAVPGGRVTRSSTGRCRSWISDKQGLLSQPKYVPCHIWNISLLKNVVFLKFRSNRAPGVLSGDPSPRLEPQPLRPPLGSRAFSGVLGLRPPASRASAKRRAALPSSGRTPGGRRQAGRRGQGQGEELREATPPQEKHTPGDQPERPAALPSHPLPPPPGLQAGWALAGARPGGPPGGPQTVLGGWVAGTRGSVGTRPRRGLSVLFYDPALRCACTASRVWRDRAQSGKVGSHGGDGCPTA